MDLDLRLFAPTSAPAPCGQKGQVVFADTYLQPCAVTSGQYLRRQAAALPWYDVHAYFLLALKMAVLKGWAPVKQFSMVYEQWSSLSLEGASPNQRPAGSCVFDWWLSGRVPPGWVTAPFNLLSVQLHSFIICPFPICILWILQRFPLHCHFQQWSVLTLCKMDCSEVGSCMNEWLGYPTPTAVPSAKLQLHLRGEHSCSASLFSATQSLHCFCLL